MTNFIEIGYRAGEVVLFNEKEKLAFLTPRKAMTLSRKAGVLGRAAIAAKMRGKAARPSTKWRTCCKRVICITRTKQAQRDHGRSLIT